MVTKWARLEDSTCDGGVVVVIVVAITVYSAERFMTVCSIFVKETVLYLLRRSLASQGLCIMHAQAIIMLKHPKIINLLLGLPAVGVGSSNLF